MNLFSVFFWGLVWYAFRPAILKQNCQWEYWSRCRNGKYSISSWKKNTFFASDL